MKTQILGTVAVIATIGTASSALAQDGLTLDFSSRDGSSIAFGGSSSDFAFNGNWGITLESGSAATGSAIGLQGAFLGGPFSYGSITTSGLLQSATVTGPTGGMVITDGANSTLSGTVNFIDISTYGRVGGFLNADVQVNLTDVIYSGNNADLQYLTANQPGSVDLTFQFNPGKTLSDLSTGSGQSVTSYSGSIAVVAVPEPASFGMSVLGGFGALIFAVRSRRSA